MQKYENAADWSTFYAGGSAMSEPRPLSGRSALVTGASRGTGAAIAQALAAMGATIIATYRTDRAAADELVARLKSTYGVDAHAVPFDLIVSHPDPANADGLLEMVADIADGVDVLVANAAAPYPKAPLRELSAQQLVEKVSQDLAATHRLVTALAPGMLSRGWGRVILIGSLHVDGPTAPGMTANGVSKAALGAYLTYAVDELTGPGVTINIVHPGYLATGASSHLPPAVPALVEALTPAQRTGEARDVAGAVTLLVRDEAEFINGARIPVSGGLNAPVALRRLSAMTRP
jgi:3-oxoacyl-[acyl-carrier protein] reductase